MAGESCNLGKDEAEIFKPSSPPSSASPPSPPSAQTPPPSASAHLQSCDEPAILRPARPDPPVARVTVMASSTPKHDVESSKFAEESETPVRFSDRCSSCRKKVGLTGFRCRCGDLFCGRHRYSDSHECSFDYKAAGREEIAKANPVIRAAKIIKI